MAQLELLTGISEPLAGEDAERLVAYVERPTVPAGHDDYLKDSDETYAQIRSRDDDA